MLSKNFKKSTLTILGIAIASVSMSTQAHAWWGGSSKKSNYRIKSEKITMESNMEKQILEASLVIKSQLELLNDTRDVIQNEESTGIQAKYKVPSNQNIKEIEIDDVNLMIKEGSTNNNPSLKYDRVYDGSVEGDISQESQKNFYKTPIQENEITHTNLNRIDVSKLSQINLSKYIQVNGATTSTPTKNNYIKENISIKKEVIKNQELQKQEVKNNIEINGLDRIVKLNGEYKITEVIKALSNGAGYEFILVGQDRDYNINIGNNEVPFQGSIKDALVNIGNSVGERALINVDVGYKIIKMEYK